jgi:hypothetical protein
MNNKIKLPKERLPMSTRIGYVHSNDHDDVRKDNRKIIEKELSEATSELRLLKIKIETDLSKD